MCLLYFTILLMLLDGGRPQCYMPSFRSDSMVAPSCCHSVSQRPFNERVHSCFEQNAAFFPDCGVNAFILITTKQTKHCVDPAARWLEQRFQRLTKVNRITFLTATITAMPYLFF